MLASIPFLHLVMAPEIAPGWPICLPVPHTSVTQFSPSTFVSSYSGSTMTSWLSLDTASCMKPAQTLPDKPCSGHLLNSHSSDWRDPKTQTCARNTLPRSYPGGLSPHCWATTPQLHTKGKVLPSWEIQSYSSVPDPSSSDLKPARPSSTHLSSLHFLRHYLSNSVLSR